MKNAKFYNNWNKKQWRSPKRLMYKGWGFTLWKWCGINIPLWGIHFGYDTKIGYDIFHNGRGFEIICKWFVLYILTSGQIAWWLGNANIRFYWCPTGKEYIW